MPDVTPVFQEMISPATSGLDTDWMDEFMSFCDALNCRIDYIGAHLYKAAFVSLFHWSRRDRNIKNS